MVGEIRDQETAQIAVQSALTGHLVFTTVHANNVIDVLGPLSEHEGRSLQLRLGPELRPGPAPGETYLRQLQARGGGRRLPVRGERPRPCSCTHGNRTYYEGAGCFECNGTGFLGRTAISELLDLSDRIRELILERRPASEIKRAAQEEGMIFLRDSALEKAFEGVTTLREINKVTFVD